MTVGREIVARTPFRLFHNHLSIEPFLGVFDYGTPSFNRLRDLVRDRVMAEAIEADLPGLIFTFVWALDVPEDREYVVDMVAPFHEAGIPVDFVELEVDPATSLSREGTDIRVAHKRSKADVAWAAAHNEELHGQHLFATSAAPDVEIPGRHTVVANGPDRTAAQTAEAIIDHLGLPRR